MKKLFAIILSLGLMLSLAACSGNPKEDNQDNAGTSSTPQSVLGNESSSGAPSQESSGGESEEASETAGTQITLTIGDLEIPAVLNDTVAAQSFQELLPFTVTASKGQYDFCGVGGDIAYDEDETQAGWKNGDIGYARGWFALFHSGEDESEGYTSEMIIGCIDDSYLETVRELPSSVEITVELADAE